MSKIIIKATTEHGTKAIQQHLKEFRKMPFRQKLIFKTSGFKQEVVTEDPGEIILHINNRHASNKLYLTMAEDQIIQGLTLNGAEKDKDYTVEVKNG